MKDTGGSIYPYRKIDHYESISKYGNKYETIPVFKDIPGMTLRDYFAGQALIGFNRPDVRKKYALYVEPEKIADSIAKVCYEQADAMIREMKK